MIVSDPITDSVVVDPNLDHAAGLTTDSDRVAVTGRITDHVGVSDSIMGVTEGSDMVEAEVDSDITIHLASILVMDSTFSSITIIIFRRPVLITTAGRGKRFCC